MAPSEVFIEPYNTRGNTISSSSSDCNEYTPTGECSSYKSRRDTYNIDFHKDIRYEKQLKLYKTILIEQVKSGWRHNHKEFKSYAKSKPNTQLINVCADGRGWAC